MSDHWQAVRERAAQERTWIRAQLPDPPDGVALARAALVTLGLEVFALPAADPLLGGARALFDPAFVAYDSTLSPAAAAFSLAHELGHRCLHGDRSACDSADIDEAFLTEPAGAGSGLIDAYHPRAQQELEANVFAAALLMPAGEVRATFHAGARLAGLAAQYGVSERAMATTLAGLLLAPAPARPVPLPAPAELPPLDASQAAAAAVPTGPVLIDAGPGTGKTRTLVERVRRLLARGEAPAAILALTFSNRAAAEMRERLGPPGAAAAAVTVSTLHGFCLHLLRAYGPLAGWPAPVLRDPVAAAAALEAHLPALSLDQYFNLHRPGLWLPDILAAISRAQDELLDPDGYAALAAQAAAAAPAGDEKARTAAARWAEVARIYAVYEQLLAAQEAVDFGGLISRAVRLLREQPTLRAHLRDTYRQILVDEYQDLNRASSVLLQLLAGDGRGLWVVGDVRQAIYRFRGASPANLAQFAADFPGARRLSLGTNYRAQAPLVALVRTVGAAMPLPDGPPATWQPAGPGAAGPCLWLATAPDGAAEAAGIAAAVAARHAAGRPYREQVILCRTHRQALPIAQALTAAGLPVFYLGPLGERPEVRDALAMLGLLAGDSTSLLRVGARQGLDRIACRQLCAWATHQAVPFPAALRQAAAAGLAPAAVAACDRLAVGVEGLGGPGDAADSLARYLFGPASPLPALLATAHPAATLQRLALGQLLALARAWTAPDGPGAMTPDVAAFLAYIRRLVAARADVGLGPQAQGDLDAVRVLTVHAAKGLEFPVVYVPNLAAGRFPVREQWAAAPPPPGLIPSGSGGTDHADEETCLFFVALSRAREELILSRAERYGSRTAAPSSLLTLLDADDPVAGWTPLSWPASPPAPAGTPPPAPVPPGGSLDMRDVELYLRCPRRYEYARVLGLAAPEDRRGVQGFYAILYPVLAQLRALQAAGTPPATADAAAALLDAAWTATGPLDHPQAAFYQQAARDLVRRYWVDLAALPLGEPLAPELHTTIGGVILRVPVDVAERGPDGTLRLTQIHPGRPRPDDTRAARLAVLGQALPADAAPITLLYPATGEQVQVVPPRGSSAALRRVAAAVAGLRAGQYPAQPDDPDGCRTCPFWIICPT